MVGSSGWLEYNIGLYFTNTAVKFLMNVKKSLFWEWNFRKIFLAFCKIPFDALNWKVQSEDLNKLLFKSIPLVPLEAFVALLDLKQFEKKREITPSPS